MIVADTSAILGLLDSASQAHTELTRAYVYSRREWVLPWAILPELDYMVGMTMGASVVAAFRADLDEGRFEVEWGGWPDLRRALELDRTYRGLALGLVDGAVMAVAERLEAHAIVTLDLRDFGPVSLRCRPQLWPRDLPRES